MTASGACHDGGMSERFTARIPAGEHEVFAAGAFDGSIGETIRVSRGGFGRDLTEGVVRAAEVTGDGSAVLLTVEVPDETVPRR